MRRGQRFVMVRLATLALLTLVAGSRPARAQDTMDGQQWTQALAIGQISPNWRTHIEVQPRLFDNASELGLNIVRTAIGRQLTPSLSLWAGHAWVRRSLGPTTHENRVWQQLSIVLPRAGRWAPSARIRLEQRRLEQWDDTVHRLRLLARAQRQFHASSPWHVAVYDEAMITLDTTTAGPYRGYDRNRLFGGVGRRLSSTFTAEFGYLWENSTIRGPLQRNEHVASAVLNVNWPRRR
jgi:hypothetical protein